MKWSVRAMAFIVAGLYLVLGGAAGYATVNALVLLWLGYDRFRLDRNRLAAVLIAVSALTLIIQQFALFAVIALLSIGLYYWRVRSGTGRSASGKLKLYQRILLDEQSWVLQSFSSWHAVGDVRMDLSLAVPEEKETTIVLEGLVGDIDLIVPDDYGIQIDASVLIGQIGWQQQKDGGMLNRLSWRSPDYDKKEQHVKLHLFYLVADIKMKPI
jgi:lia operon protein LiaF